MRRFNPERKDVLFANTETAKYFIENFIDFNASGNFAELASRQSDIFGRQFYFLIQIKSRKVIQRILQSFAITASGNEQSGVGSKAAGYFFGNFIKQRTDAFMLFGRDDQAFFGI